MTSKNVVEQIGSLYAGVYDEALDSEAARALKRAINDELDTDDALRKYQEAITRTLLRAIDQSAEFELYTAQEPEPEFIYFTVTALAPTEESRKALEEMCQVGNASAPNSEQHEVTIASRNLSNDARRLANIGLGKAIAIRVRELSLPVLAGDETTDVTTSSTALGDQPFASQRAVPMWLTHISKSAMSGFVRYRNPGGEILQVKFNARGNYFPVLLTDEADHRDVKKIPTARETEEFIVNWLAASA